MINKNKEKIKDLEEEEDDEKRVEIKRDFYGSEIKIERDFGVVLTHRNSTGLYSFTNRNLTTTTT